MPRFYFDFRNGAGLMRDDEGTEHPDVKSAEQEAIEVAAAVARDHFPLGVTSIIVEVRDEQGQQVMVATVSLQVERPP